ncbi:MAG: hypothetical protein QHJ34_14875 [bacterium]|nr:hypothetical protein [candidate division KSB1 bacterium]MDH7561485.1 hypothetical protein [bacterium]
MVSFTSPTPEGAEYLGGNHPFVAALARYLVEEALGRQGAAAAARCGVMRAGAVSHLTNLLLLRARYLLEQTDRAPLLSEEVLVLGYRAGGTKEPQWRDNNDALRLLVEARPDANVPMAEKRELVRAALAQIGEWPKEGADLEQASAIQQHVGQVLTLRAQA